MDRNRVVALAIRNQTACLYALASAEHFRHSPGSIGHIREAANSTFLNSKKSLLDVELNQPEIAIFNKLEELRLSYKLNAISSVSGSSIVPSIHLVVERESIRTPLLILLSFLCSDVQFSTPVVHLLSIYTLGDNVIRSSTSRLRASFDSSSVEYSSASIFNYLIQTTSPHFDTTAWYTVVDICVRLRLPLLPDASTGLGIFRVPDTHVIDIPYEEQTMPVWRSLLIDAETLSGNNIDVKSATEAVDPPDEEVDPPDEDIDDDGQEPSNDVSNNNSEGEEEDEASKPKEHKLMFKSKLKLATNEETLDDILNKLAISREITGITDDQSYPTHIRTLLKKWQTMFLFLVGIEHSVELMEAIKKTRS